MNEARIEYLLDHIQNRPSGNAHIDPKIIAELRTGLSAGGTDNSIELEDLRIRLTAESDRANLSEKNYADLLVEHQEFEASLKAKDETIAALIESGKELQQKYDALVPPPPEVPVQTTDPEPHTNVGESDAPESEPEEPPVTGSHE
jgi:hypothetical protein